jgi:hypothetical protein
MTWPLRFAGKNGVTLVAPTLLKATAMNFSHPSLLLAPRAPLAQTTHATHATQGGGSF